jgi:hypothetical protein
MTAVSLVQRLSIRRARLSLSIGEPTPIPRISALGRKSAIARDSSHRDHGSVRFSRRKIPASARSTRVPAITAATGDQHSTTSRGTRRSRHSSPNAASPNAAAHGVPLDATRKDDTGASSARSSGAAGTCHATSTRRLGSRTTTVITARASQRVAAERQKLAA